MCRSKAEGGNRCRSHIKMTLNQQKEKLDYWLIEVEQRKLQAENEPNALNRRKVRDGEKALEGQKEKISALDDELFEAEKRASQERKTRKPVHTSFLNADLRQDEWEQLNQEARLLGYRNRSQFIRARLTEMPTIEASKAEDIPYLEIHGGNDTGGRPATEGVSGSYERGTRGVKLPPAELERLEAEADIFGISRSDYVRALILGQDPRKLGNHMADDRKASIKKNIIAWAEENAKAGGGVSTTRFWKRAITEVRANHANKYASSTVADEAEAFLQTQE